MSHGLGRSLGEQISCRVTGIIHAGKAVFWGARGAPDQADTLSLHSPTQRDGGVGCLHPWDLNPSKSPGALAETERALHQKNQCPESNRAFLEVAAVGDLSSLEWVAFSVRFEGGARIPCEKMERKAIPSRKNHLSDGLSDGLRQNTFEEVQRVLIGK